MQKTKNHTVLDMANYEWTGANISEFLQEPEPAGTKPELELT